MKSLPNITLKLGGQDWFGNVERHAYTKGGAPALTFIDSHGDEIATLTVNMPEQLAASRDVVAIKDYSENEGVFAQLVALKIVKPLDLTIPSGFVQIPVAEIIHPQLLEQEKSRFKEWACDCGHEVLDTRKPQPIKWTDGHICNFHEQEEKS